MDASSDKSHILVVDDDTRLRELLKNFLSRNDFRVSTAASAAEARQRLGSLDFDLIVLDVMMPGMNGYQVCRALKADPATKGIPIIMVTALHEMSDIERGVEVGTDDFITKPVNRVDLLTRVRSLLRLRDVANPDEREMDYLDELEDR